MSGVNNMCLLSNQKISVIVPVYNTEEYLEECFESIFNQSYKNIEVIAINDGSTDGSYDRLRQIQNSRPDLIIKTQVNHGPGASRNLGIRNSSGEYLYFMDSDDIIEPNMFEKAIMLINKNNCDFAGFQADIFGDIERRDCNQYKYVDKFLENEKIYYGIEFQKEFFLKLPIYNVPFCIYKRRFIEENNLKFMEDVIYEDKEFYWHTMACDPKFVVSKEVMYHRRYREASIMTSINYELSFKSRLKVFNKITYDATYELCDIYLYHSLSWLNLSLGEAMEKGYLPDIEDFSEISIFLKEIIENISEITVLHKLLILSYIDKLSKMGYMIEKKDFLIKNIREDVMLDEVLSKLYERYNKVAIYGTGDFAQIVIDVLEMAIGKFSANIVYIDTYAKTGEKQFRNNCVFNYQDVDLDDFDKIIIMSELYETEIKRNIVHIGDRRKVVSLLQYIK